MFLWVISKRYITRYYRRRI